MTEAALFYEASSPGIGADFLDDVQRTIERLIAYPESGEAIDLDLRRTLLHRFPFSLIYTIEESGILIVAVSHHGRAPEYWQLRVN